LFAVADFLMRPGLFVVYGISLVLSIVLLVRRRRSFYIPLIAGVTMIAMVAIPLKIAGQRS
jgi:high-affinity Fe2+/Pb2+ permease